MRNKRHTSRPLLLGSGLFAKHLTSTFKKYSFARVSDLLRAHPSNTPSLLLRELFKYAQNRCQNRQHWLYLGLVCFVCPASNDAGRFAVILNASDSLLPNNFSCLSRIMISKPLLYAGAFCLALTLLVAPPSDCAEKTMALNPDTPQPDRFVVRGTSLIDLNKPEKARLFSRHGLFALPPRRDTSPWFASRER